MIKNVIVDTGAISAAPTGVGQIAYNNGTLYVATGTASVNDWTALATGGNTEDLETQINYLKTLVGMDNSGDATNAPGSVTGRVTAIEGGLGTSETAASPSATVAWARIKNAESDIDTLEGKFTNAFASGSGSKVTVTGGVVTDVTNAAISDVTGLQTELDNKLDDNQLVTSWTATTLNTQVPSEKLVKDSLDQKIDTVSLDNSSASIVKNGSAVAIGMSAYALKSDISSAYIYRGSVAAEGNLPTTGLTAGDVYNIVAASSYGIAGTNVAWTGTAWDALGGTVDMSNYYTKTEADANFIDVIGSAAGSKVVISTAAGEVTESGIDSTHLGYLSDVTSNIQAQLNGKVDENAAITAVTTPTFLKVSYDEKGLVTGSAAVAAIDIPTIEQSQVNGLATALGGKVDVVSGSSLVPDTEITKLAGIEAGAQVNVIETVKVNGTALTVDAQKAVDVTVPTSLVGLDNTTTNYQNATQVSSAISGAIETNNANYYTKTAVQGYFQSKAVSNVATDSITVTGGTAYMAQLLDNNGYIIGADIQLSGATATFTASQAISGTFRVLFMPN